jgi:hypothetical protein
MSWVVASRRASASLSGGDDVQTHHCMRSVELGRRLEAFAIDLKREVQRIGREMRGEGEWQPKFGGELRPECARSQDPERHRVRRDGHGLHPLALLRRQQIGLQLDHVLREAVGARRIAPQRPHRGEVGPRRAAQPEVDTIRKQRRQRAELLGDHQRRMIGKHDAPRPHPDAARPRRDMRDHDRGRGAGDARHVMMLGHPETPVAQRLRLLRRRARMIERGTRVGPLADPHELENR